MTLEDVSLATKVGTRFLRALEEERLDQLPGGVFNKGFIRAYASHLGLDENEILADYLAAVEEKTSAALNPGGTPPRNESTAPAEAPAKPRKPEPQMHLPVVPVFERPREHADLIPWGKMAAALVVVAFGFALWGSFSRQPWEEHRRRPEKLLAPQAETKPAESAAASLQPGSSPLPAPAAGEQPVAASPEAAPLNSVPAPSPVSATQPAGRERGNPAPSGTFTVLIQARKDSWVHITADGKEVMHDMLAANKQKAVAAQKEVVVRAGNIGGLDFSFNGKRLPAQGEPDEVKTVTFGADGLQAPVSRKPELQAGRPQA